MNPAKADYTALDHPEVLAFLFHPRKELAGQAATDSAGNVFIPVADDISVGGRFHMAHLEGPNILFFHGNGEIVADYDDLGPVYNQMGINFLAVDYRGYGRSSGQPTVTNMMQDCHTVFDFARNWLQDNRYQGPLLVMGRSLGSASALELAWQHPAQMDALVIESGFAHAGPLLQLLGINLAAIGFDETQGFGHIDKMKTFKKPTLIIHAEYDHIIPFSDGQALFDACPSPAKSFLKIAGANHNDIFMRGMADYLAAIKKLVKIL
ncbi:MAG: alpha/beta hydrolase [Desulfobacterales bacterium]|nr:alpha/beta hydrolase [Desulfobacterales bacterium]